MTIRSRCLDDLHIHHNWRAMVGSMGRENFARYPHALAGTAPQLLVGGGSAAVDVQFPGRLADVPDGTSASLESWAPHNCATAGTAQQSPLLDLAANSGDEKWMLAAKQEFY